MGQGQGRRTGLLQARRFAVAGKRKRRYAPTSTCFSQRQAGPNRTCGVQRGFLKSRKSRDGRSVRKTCSRGTLEVEAFRFEVMHIFLGRSTGIVLSGCHWVVICLTYLSEWLGMSRRTSTPRSRLAHGKSRRLNG